jgi:hypothetical protein
MKNKARAIILLFFFYVRSAFEDVYQQHYSIQMITMSYLTYKCLIYLNLLKRIKLMLH